VNPGTRLGRYEIRAKLGEGGMGEVYRAFDAKMNREVAIKVLSSELSHNKDRLARFEQEAQAAGALNHPNILVIHHIDTHDGAPYIVSELLEGEELCEHLDNGRLALRKTIDYAQQIVSALSAAHGKGIVHRDLKPEKYSPDDRFLLYWKRGEKTRWDDWLTFEKEPAKALFATRMMFSYGGGEAFDVTPDGKFLIGTLVGEPTAPAPTVILNWYAALKQ
jgi:hypothetical protein